MPRIDVDVSNRNPWIPRLVMGLWMTLCWLPGSLFAQATSDPNQIVGTVRLTNQNPDLVADLVTYGLHTATIYANSTGVSPSLNNNTGLVVEGGQTGRYEVTVEAGPVGSGIVYVVSADLRLRQGRNRIQLPSVATDAVEVEPAPDVQRDLEVCLGRIDLIFEDEQGQPVTLNTSSVNFNQETAPGSGNYSWRGNGGSSQAAEELRFFVPTTSSTNYQLAFSYTFGSDVFEDFFRFQQTLTTQIACDEIVPLVVTIPSPDDSLGRIVGQVDMLGEEEVTYTYLSAYLGPFGNDRLDRIDPPFPASFELPNLLPSTVVDPPVGYRVQAVDLRMRRDDRFMVFRTPQMLVSNGGTVVVHPGETVDLGNTFVIDPGYVGGDVHLTGPTQGSTGQESCLDAMYRDFESDRDGDGIPNNIALSSGSTVRAFGTLTAAPGATFTSQGGFATTSFSGSLDAVSGELAGDYELVLGGLQGESTHWTVGNLAFRFEDRTDPEAPSSYFNSWIHTSNQESQQILVEPGATREVDFNKCFSQVNVGLS